MSILPDEFGGGGSDSSGGEVDLRSSYFSVEFFMSILFPESSSPSSSSAFFYTVCLVVSLLVSVAILAWQHSHDLAAPSSLITAYTRAKAPPPPQRSSSSTSPLSSSSSAVVVREYERLRNVYLVGFTLMTLADWLQGPFLYSMYRSFGLQDADVAFLYSLDYASAAVASIFVGVFNDLVGAKIGCVLYGILYAIACLCNHAGVYSIVPPTPSTAATTDRTSGGGGSTSALESTLFSIVALGCVIDGVCNALLRTSFESWIAAIATRTQKKFSNYNNNDIKKQKKSAITTSASIDDDDTSSSSSLWGSEWGEHISSLGSWVSAAASVASGLVCHAIVATLRSLPSQPQQESTSSPFSSFTGEFLSMSDGAVYTATMDCAALLLFFGTIVIATQWETDGDANDDRCPTTTTTDGGADETAKNGEIGMNAKGRRPVLSSQRTSSSSSSSSSSLLCLFSGLPKLLSKAGNVTTQQVRTVLVLGAKQCFASGDPTVLCLCVFECAMEAALLLFIAAFPATLQKTTTSSTSSSGDVHTDTDGDDVPFGFAFVCLMSSILTGSTIFNVVMHRRQRQQQADKKNETTTTKTITASAVRQESHHAIFAAMCGIGAAASVAIIGALTPSSASTTTDWTLPVVFVSLCLCEVCFGYYYPALYSLHEQRHEQQQLHQEQTSTAASESVATVDVRSTCVGIIRATSYAVALLALSLVQLQQQSPALPSPSAAAAEVAAAAGHDDGGMTGAGAMPDATTTSAVLTLWRAIALCFGVAFLSLLYYLYLLRCRCNNNCAVRRLPAKAKTKKRE